MNLKTLLIAATLVALPASSTFAQSTTYKQRHTVKARDARQQARINKGVADGQITPKGAAAADAHQAKLNQEQSNMRAADNGAPHRRRPAQDRPPAGPHLAARLRPQSQRRHRPRRRPEIARWRSYP